MPLKKVRPDLVKRLKRDIKLKKLTADGLGKMRNIDSRKDAPMVQFYEYWNKRAWKKADFPGARVRLVTLTKNFKGQKLGKPVEIVLKRTHDHSAKESIRFAKRLAKKFNKQNRFPWVKMIEPKAEAISENIIAMSRSHNPTAATLMRDSTGSKESRSFWENLKKTNKKAWEKLFLAKSEGKCEDMLIHIYKTTGMSPDDFLVAKWDGQNLTLIPLPDIPVGNPTFI